MIARTRMREDRSASHAYEHGCPWSGGRRKLVLRPARRGDTSLLSSRSWRLASRMDQAHEAHHPNSGWRFNANRMVMDYTTKCYIPTAGGASSHVRAAGWDQ